MAKHFLACRGGGQTFNAGTLDLNNLSAFFLEQSRDQPGAIRAVIDANAEVGGWLILATHDVCEQPTPFGCRPDLFEAIVDWTIMSDSTVLPVHRAWEAIRARKV